MPFALQPTPAELAAAAARDAAAAACAALTQRERQVLVLTCKDMTGDEIGRALHLSRKTVQCYRDRAYVRLQVRGIAGAAVVATRAGLV